MNVQAPRASPDRRTRTMLSAVNCWESGRQPSGGSEICVETARTKRLSRRASEASAMGRRRGAAALCFWWRNRQGRERTSFPTQDIEHAAQVTRLQEPPCPQRGHRWTERRGKAVEEFGFPNHGALGVKRLQSVKRRDLSRIPCERWYACVQYAVRCFCSNNFVSRVIDDNAETHQGG